MKKSFGGFDIEISDWTPKLKIVTIIFAAITIVSSAMTLIFKYTVPGLVPIGLGVTMLLLGTREFNMYFKERKSRCTLALGIVLTLIFAFNLYIGIDQIVTTITKQVGL